MDTYVSADRNSYHYTNNSAQYGATRTTNRTSNRTTNWSTFKFSHRPANCSPIGTIESTIGTTNLHSNWTTNVCALWS